MLRFTSYFAGFFPRKDAARKQVLEELRSLRAALIFYESPNRVVDSLKCIEEAFPLRPCAVCRELTKVHEEVVRGLPAEVIAELGARQSIKGEIVIVVDGPTEEEGEAEVSKDQREATRWWSE